jgi:CDP-diacylglycerol--glycerol-3-phosphate 3-phosphatidyltransferase
VNLPNTITLSRLVMTAVFVVAASLGGTAGHGVALVTFVLAAASDWLDGWLARRMGLVTPLGKLLDPLADKILVCSGFVFFTGAGLCPLWVTALIISREFLVTGLRQIAVEAGQVLAADQLGKWKTGFQLAFCISGLVWLTCFSLPQSGIVVKFLTRLTDPDWWPLPACRGVAVALTFVSGFNYLWASRHLLRGK